MKLIKKGVFGHNQKETVYFYDGNKVMLCDSGLLETFGRVPDSIEVRLKSPKKKGWVKCEYKLNQITGYVALYVRGVFTILCGTERNFINKYVTNNMEHKVFYIKGGYENKT